LAAKKPKRAELIKIATDTTKKRMFFIARPFNFWKPGKVPN
jgi:hypothetical protein